MSETLPLSTLGGLLGGIGLFLLGMHMLTEGLKLAAGKALEGLLERSTSTRLRGLAAGVLITALVQTSTAVTVAGIGFVNTGLLSLQNAMWVIFGSNLGSTVNTWLVAALGFGFRIQSFALPFIGVGVIVSMVARTLRARALGRALAGFGLLFLGFAVLKDNFSFVGGQIDLSSWLRTDLIGVFILVGIGTVLTVLMQTSSAVIALVITAAQGGLLPIDAACAIVIGTNIGTPSTAILAAIGATANARRLAAVHVLFNLVTGIVALLLLPAMVALIEQLRIWFEQLATPAMMIVVFHTSFNVLGVLLMIPIAGPMLRTLRKRFRTREEEISRPRHLDANSLQVPDLALRALRMELNRTQRFARNCAHLAISRPAGRTRLAREADALDALEPAITSYARQMSASQLPPTLIEALARALRSLQHQLNAVDAARQADAAATLTGTPPAEFEAALQTFHASLERLAARADPQRSDFQTEAITAGLAAVKKEYGKVRETMLRAGAHALIDIDTMQDWLRLVSLQRRSVDQAAKAARMLATVQEEHDPQATATVDAYERDERADDTEDAALIESAR